MAIQPLPVALQRRLLFVLFIAESLIGAAGMLSFTFLPIVAAMLTANPRLAGVPLTITALGRALAAYPIGWLMDKSGRRVGLLLGYLTTILGALLCVVALNHTTFLLLCLSAALYGVSLSALGQARFAAGEIVPPARRARAIGLIVFADAVGALGTPWLIEPAGAFAERYGMVRTTGPYLLAAFLALVTGVIVFTLLHPDPKTIGMAMAEANGGLPPGADARQAGAHRAKADRGLGSGAQGADRPLRQLFAMPAVYISTSVLVVSQLVTTLFAVIAPLHMHNFHASDSNITLALTAYTFGSFGVSSLTSWLIDRTSRHLMLLVGALVMALATVGLALAASPVAPGGGLAANGFFTLAPMLFLLGLGWNFCFIAGSSLLSDALAPEERGRAQGATEMMVALAAGIASLSSGAVFAQGGMLAVGMLGLVISLALAGLVSWSIRQQATILANF